MNRHPHLTPCDEGVATPTALQEATCSWAPKENCEDEGPEVVDPDRWLTQEEEEEEEKEQQKEQQKQQAR